MGEGDLLVNAPVVWQNALTPPPSDPVLSTNDVFIDPETGDTHLVARTRSAAAVYYHRPAGGAFSGPHLLIPAAARARLVPHAGGVALVYGPTGRGLAVRLSRGRRPAGQPIPWTDLAEHPIDLPAGYQTLYAIYPESPAYQAAAPSRTIEVALVGSAREFEVLHVSLEAR